MDKERRKYFRINDMVILNYKVIDASALERGRQILATGIQEHIVQRKRILGLEVQLKGLLQQLRDEFPKAADALSLINQKLDAISEGVKQIDPEKKRLVYRSLEDVNISAGGVGLKSKTDIPVGTYMSLELILCPNYDYILCFGCVKHSQRRDDGFYLGVEYVEILDEDREKIISHVLKCQTAELRQARLKRESQQGISSLRGE